MAHEIRVPARLLQFHKFKLIENVIDHTQNAFVALTSLHCVSVVVYPSEPMQPRVYSLNDAYETDSILIFGHLDKCWYLARSRFLDLGVVAHPQHLEWRMDRGFERAPCTRLRWKNVEGFYVCLTNG